MNNLFVASQLKKLKEYKQNKEEDDVKEKEKQDALREKNKEKHKKYSFSVIKRDKLIFNIVGRELTKRSCLKI